EEAGQARVPRVRVDDAGIDRIASHRESDGEGLEHGDEARPARLAAHAIPRGVPTDWDSGRWGRGIIEAADLDRHAYGEGARELMDDRAGPAVDVRWVFASQNERFHEPIIKSREGRVELYTSYDVLSTDGRRRQSSQWLHQSTSCEAMSGRYGSPACGR